MALNKFNGNLLSNKIFNFFFYFLFPFILYFFINWLYFANWNKLIKGYVYNLSGDPEQSIWFIKWWPWSILHGINPFISYYIWSPNGFNLTWATSMPSLAIMASPITLIFGPIAAYNILCLLALPLSAYSAFLLLRYITKNPFASFVGGYLFGFSSYEIAEASGHLNLIFVFIIPLICYLVIKRYHDVAKIDNHNSMKRKRLIFILLLATMIAFQVGISSEVAATMTFFGFISIGLFYIFANKDNRLRIFRLSVDIAVAYFVSMILLSPFLYYIVVGYSQVPKIINSPTYYSADLLNYIVSTPVTRFGRTIFANIVSRFTGNYSEDGAYIGVILIATVLFSIKEQLKNWWGKAIVIITAVVFASSLGPYLHINGVVTKIPLLWRLFVYLPILRDPLPTRFTMYVFLMVAIFITLWLNKKNISKKDKIYRYVIVFFGLVLILPNTNIDSWGTIKTPQFFKDKNIMKRFINKEKTVLIFPYNNGGLMDYYQMKSKMYFKMPEGYSGFVPKNFIDSPAFGMFNSNKISYDYILVISAFIGSHNVRAVILTPGTPKIWHLAFNDMHAHWKKIKAGGVTLYEVPNIILQSYKHITLSQLNQKISLLTFNRLYNLSMKFLKNNQRLSNLFPQYLEFHGYLSKSFGYQTGSAINWTKNGGWIGRWGCPDGKGECFGVGIVGNINNLKPIIQKYQSQAKQIFFPYPKVYNANKSSKGSGQLLMIFNFNKKIIK
jgi:hypothetical protein